MSTDAHHLKIFFGPSGRSASVSRLEQDMRASVTTRWRERCPCPMTPTNFTVWWYFAKWPNVALKTKRNKRKRTVKNDNER